MNATLMGSDIPLDGAREGTRRMSRDRVESFLYREADLADEHRFDEWLALWDQKDILYWIPAGSDDIDPRHCISIAYDNRERLEDRIFRLQSKAVHAQRPRSRMRRIIGNIVIEADDGATATVRANFIFTEMRHGHQDVFNGRFIYQLRYNDDSLLIGSKKVLLVNNDEFIDNLTFLL